jgi:hypothetical protein
VEIKCPNCGSENWLENQSRCLQCNAILRRCIDCAAYEQSRGWCREVQTEIDPYEAQHPSLLSTSTNCSRFRVGPQAVA